MEKETMKATDLAVSTVGENEVVSRDDIAGAGVIERLTNPGGGMYCSIENTNDRKTKAKIFNAINGNGQKIANHIGKTIKMKDVVAHPVSLTDENTGEIVEAARVVLIDDKGESYAGVSEGIMNSLQKIFMIYGEPKDWEEPIEVEVCQQATRNGNNKVNTLKVVG